MNKIPKVLYQVFKTKELSEEMKEIVDSWKIHNKNYECILYDHDDSENFIKSNFDDDVINAYYKLRYPAHRADLWRYCILYKYGGVYADLDTLCLGSIDDFIDEGIELVSVIDLDKTCCLANAFIAVIPSHPIMKLCIDRIIFNTKNKVDYKDKRYVGGPGVLGPCVNKYFDRDENMNYSFENVRNLNNFRMLNFHNWNEFVTSENGEKKLFQNKNGNSKIIKAYRKECHKNNVNMYWTCGSPYL